MKRPPWMLVFFFTLIGFGMHSLIAADNSPPAGNVDALLKLHRDGNHAEAFDGLKQWILSPDIDSKKFPEAYQAAVQCLVQLGRVQEFDRFAEQVVQAHPQKWPVLFAVANSYYSIDHTGFLIAGEFERGRHRGGGKVVNVLARDRAMAIRLFHQAWQLAAAANEADRTQNLMLMLARTLQYDNFGSQSWRMQSLTDLDTLPEMDEGWGLAGGQIEGAPVDAEGNPIYYNLPNSWDKATNDGERWRWALEQYSKLGDDHWEQASLYRADFLRSQFGVQTLAYYGNWFTDPGDDEKKKAGIWSLHTLKDNETIARLATGIKRFELPDEHNHVKLYQAILDRRKEAARRPLDPCARLAEVSTNRRQYPRAAEYLELAIEASITDHQRENYQRQLDQIVKNWGRFEGTMTQPTGTGAKLDYRFRNGTSVELVAHRIDIDKLLADVKAYLKANPGQLDWNKMQIENLGHRLVTEKQTKYIAEEVARWNLELEPAENHFDRHIEITTPLQSAGAYLLTATMKDGNVSKIIIWLADTALVRKPMQSETLYYVADAVTGQPLEKANVEFFGYWQEHRDGKQYTVHTKQFAELTDAGGQAFLPVVADDGDQKHRRMQWLATATTGEGRLAYLGFSNIWKGRHREQQYRANKVFTITDRPVYRPNQTVQFKFWVRHAQYDQEDNSQFANKTFTVEIHNPKNEKAYAQTLAADQYGGIQGEFLLPDDAALGQYRLQVVNHGGSTFRVEEYKKPEFEVIVEAPEEPVQLGDTITATIRAKYYFGSPVAHAKVKYKVLRSEHHGSWYPPDPWDWLYGSDYWWFGYDYDWYPGWRRWGCLRPSPPWFWHRPAPPEVVAEQVTDIGSDGTVEITIDTSLAKEMHGNQDHSYQIQADVTDESRRTIVGNGRVLVSRKPFKVFAWVDRGHYSVGDTVLASFAARRLDGKPVQGSGKLRLLKLSYPDDKTLEPKETEVRSWDLPTNQDGRAEITFSASEAGQYRLSYTVTDKAGHAIEGGYIFTIRGQGFDGSDFHFNDLEIVPDARDYAPGDTVKLQINTNRPGSTVLLFPRPSNGIYLPPQVLRLDGKSTQLELGVTKKDMPNFFVEAVTVSSGEVHTQVREIHVPPAQRMLNVEVVPSAEEFQPGQQASLKLKLTDAEGNPFVGSTVLSVYDKSVEYISGGSNVPGIKEFFWKWQRKPSTARADESRAASGKPHPTCADWHGQFGGVWPFGGR